MSDVRRQWEQAAAGWRSWRKIFEQRDDHERYIEAAGIKAGWRVLDVGAGAGDQTIPLAHAVGPDGRVVATDISQPMLDIIRERAGEQGLDNVETIVSDGEELALDGPPFDAAVSGFMLMIAAEPERAAARVREHLKPGATFVASVWSTPDKAPMMSTAVMIGVGQFGMEPPPVGKGGLFALGDPARLGGVLESTGFEDVTVEPLPMPLRFPNPDDYAAMIRDTAVVLSDHVEAQLQDRVEEFWAAVGAAAADQAAEDGSVTFHNEGLMVTGRSPG